MENNDLEKNQSSLDFENEELSIFNQEKPVSKIISDFKSIKQLDGFLIGGASKSSKNFIDIIKNFYK